jgi:glycosyltransferase involved in cell wall biosynthesis
MNSSGQRYHVIVVSNYGPDDQPSMLRYAESLAEGLRARGHQVEQLAPRPFFIRGGGSLNGAKKWLGYLDKFLLFPFILHHKLSQARRSSLPVILHICDHSNAPYAFWSGMTPVVVTCHDVGAIKGARGLLPDCPATLLGRLLQKWIGAGLRRASRVACVSKFTAVELAELVMGGVIQTLRVVPNGFNRDFQKLNWAQSQEVIKRWPLLGSGGSYILHVGSGLRRKNREVVLKVFAQVWR